MDVVNSRKSRLFLSKSFSMVLYSSKVSLTSNPAIWMLFLSPRFKSVYQAD